MKVKPWTDIGKPVGTYYTIPELCYPHPTIKNVYRIQCNRCADILYGKDFPHMEWKQICHCNTEYFYHKPSGTFYGVGSILSDVCGWENLWVDESSKVLPKLIELGVIEHE